MPTVASTAIAALDYDVETQVLTITFHKGGRYELNGVPEIEYERFLGAASKGQYWNMFMKGKY